jgi:predicted Zn-dependent protease
MPRVILLFFILGLIGLAIHRMMAAIEEQHIRTYGPPRPDFPENGADVPAWLHAVITGAYAAEREGWALDMVRRVDARLQANRPPEERFESVILWIPELNAFTMPGRHLYLSRRLVERVHDDDALAFIVAHEIAHHDLGHLPDAEEWGREMDSLGSALAGPFTFLLQRRLAGAERESDADTHGLNLCLAAGYDPHRCLRAFDLLEMAQLDWGNVEGVFGPDSAIDSELAGHPKWVVELKEWMWERRRGYPSVRERKARLLAAYEAAAAETARRDAEAVA